MKKRYQEINLAGVTFEDRQVLLRRLYEENSSFDVTLASDPDNAYDSQAVRVVGRPVSQADSYLLGFIPREHNKKIRPETTTIKKYELTRHPKKDIICVKLFVEYEDNEPRVYPEEIV